MKIPRKILVIIVLSLWVIKSSISQNIGINEPNPDNSALLEMTSSERGLLVPRMTEAERDAIVNPAEGLIIYNINDTCLNLYRYDHWYNMCCCDAGTPCVAPAITSHPVDVSINTGDDANYTVTATGTAPLTYQWQENTGSGWSDITNGGTNPIYSGATTASLTLTTVPVTYDTYDYQCVVTNTCGSATSNSGDLAVVATSLICGSPIIITNVTNTYTGDTWMDRNLGASQQATAYNDYQAYGALFQWGRLSDGHECITWTSSTTGTPDNGATSTNSPTDNPGHSDFILEPNSPYDWRDPQNDNLWQGVSGINNPCPSGYRLPTYLELENERLSWVQAPISSTNNYNGAYASPLKLVVAGYNRNDFSSLSLTGIVGFYWSSSVQGTLARSLRYDNASAGIYGYGRALGLSVRCIKD